MTDLSNNNLSNNQELNRIYIIIPAAGLSSRMGGKQNKQFMEIEGIPVITRTLNAFREFEKSLISSDIKLSAILVTQEKFIPDLSDLVAKNGFDFVEKIISGGNTRTESVYNGILSLQNLAIPPRNNDIVFIHDGARCLVNQGLLLRCLNAGICYPISTVAVDMKNTIKKVVPVNAPENFGGEFATTIHKLQNAKSLEKYNIFDEPIGAVKVVETPKRSNFKEVQTPQIFRYDKLIECYENAISNHIEATDDTSLAEALNYDVHIIEGSYSNIKITTPDDIELAELLLRKSDEIC